VEEKWLEEYGPAVKYKGFLGVCPHRTFLINWTHGCLHLILPPKMNQLFTADPKVLNHIMMNTYDYQKPAAVQRAMERIVGPGLLTVEADRHKRQVRFRFRNVNLSS
jgi:hypothetical protein